jgi:WD40 repeat protein
MEGWKDVKSIHMSPDGKHVATLASGGNTNEERAAKRIQIWNVDSGERVVNVVVEKPFSGETNMCAISPDMRTLVAGVYEPNKWSVKAWDTRTGKELFSRALRPKGVPDFWFNDAGTELLVFQGTLFVRTFLYVRPFPSSRGVSGSVEIWDARTGKTRVAMDGPFPDGVASAVISPDGRWVATAAIAYHSDNPLAAKPTQVKLWDTVTGKAVRTMMPLPPLAEKNEQNFNFSLAFSPSGDRLATGYVRGTSDGKYGRLEPEHVQVWDVATGEIRWQRTDDNQSHNFITVCFGGEGSLLHVAGSSGTTFDGTRDDRRKTQRSPVRKAIPGMRPVEAVCSPSGDQFATLWENDKPEPGVPRKLELRVDDAAGRELLRVTDLAEPPPAKNDAEITTEVISRKVVFSPNGRKIAFLVTHSTGPIKKYNEIIAKFPAVVLYPAGQPPKKPKEIKEELLQALPGSAVRSRLRVWDLGSGKELHGRQVAVDSPSPRFLPISDAWFTPDGTQLTAIQQRIPGQFQPDQVQELKIEGEINARDGKEPVREGCYRKSYPYRMEAGKHYRIDHMAKVRDYALDPFLILKDPGGKVVAWDDDGGGYLNARVLYKATVTGEHQIVCTTCDPDMFGRFLLTVVGSSQQEKSWGGSRIVTWDLVTGQETGSFTRTDELFNHGVYSADGRSMILAGRFKQHYRRVDARTGMDLEKIPINLRDGINMTLHEEGFEGRHAYYDYDTSTQPQTRIILSPDGRQFYHQYGKGPAPIDRETREITLYNLARVREPSQYNLDLDRSTTCIAVSPDGRRVVAACGGGGKKPTFHGIIWDNHSRLKLAQFELPGSVRAMAFTPDSRYLGWLISVDEGRAVEFHLLDGSPQPGRKVLDKLRR